MFSSVKSVAVVSIFVLIVLLFFRQLRACDVDSEAERSPPVNRFSQKSFRRLSSVRRAGLWPTLNRWK